MMMRSLAAGLIAAAVGLVGKAAVAEVWLDLEPYAAAATGRRESLLQFVEYQVELALAGGGRFMVNVRTEDGDIALEEELVDVPSGEVSVVVDKDTWVRLSPGIKHRILEDLGQKLGNLVTAYHIRVSKAHNPDLRDEPLLDELGIDVTPLPETFDAKRLLSQFVVENAEQETSLYGPNCWHASIAAVSEHADAPRLMNEREFACHVSSWFQQVEAPERLGDLIRLRDNHGRDVHAFTYIGRDRAMPDRRIVLTKNGKTPGAYLFMELDAVLALYSGSEPSYYRRIMRDEGEDVADPWAACAP